MPELIWIALSIFLLVALVIILFVSSAIISDYREKLREARLEIRVLTLHDEEIRRMYPLAEGRKLMKSPRWTEIEEDTNHD